MTRNERRAIADAFVYVVLLFSGVFISSDRVSLLRDGTALSPCHGKFAQKPGDTISDTISVDVPICSERAERRASALARRPRATA